MNASPDNVEHGSNRPHGLLRALLCPVVLVIAGGVGLTEKDASCALDSLEPAGTKTPGAGAQQPQPSSRDSNAGGSLRIVQQGDGHAVALTRSVEIALSKRYREFHVWSDSDYAPFLVPLYEFSPQQAPFAAIGDFNADGEADVALHGHDQKYDYVVCVVSARGRTRVIEVVKRPLADAKVTYDINNYGLLEFLQSRPPGLVHGFDAPPLHLRTDGFEVVYFEKGSVLYYFSSGKLQSYVTAD